MSAMLRYRDSIHASIKRMAGRSTQTFLKFKECFAVIEGTHSWYWQASDSSLAFTYPGTLSEHLVQNTFIFFSLVISLEPMYYSKVDHELICYLVNIICLFPVIDYHPSQPLRQKNVMFLISSIFNLIEVCTELCVVCCEKKNEQTYLEYVCKNPLTINID